MATETQKIAMRMDADARLVAAAGGVARYFADAAGLAGASVSDLQSAIITVCKQEIGELEKSEQELEVTLTRMPDRIEVAVSRPAQALANAEKETPKTIAGVDQIEREIRADRKVTRLTKYVSASASSD
ncbi:MAG: hypothetical protein M3P45_14840 [Acidobacteriota bacterium]|nr:hypothetical protein [Acidobacteriota bacterium]